MSENAILFVGYEPSSGTLVSVGGVTVLGMRQAYEPPALMLATNAPVARRGSAAQARVPKPLKPAPISEPQNKPPPLSQPPTPGPYGGSGNETLDFNSGYAVGKKMCSLAKKGTPQEKLNWMTETSIAWQSGWAKGVGDGGCVQRCEPAGWPCFITAT